MAADSVMQPLIDAGVRVVRRDVGRLWAGPPERITDELRAYLDDHRVAIAAELSYLGNRQGGVNDPRPDLESDAALWQKLLRRARMHDATDPDGCFWSLLGARCMSAELTETPGTLQLRPRPGLEDDYEQIRPHLNRNRRELTALLKRPATRVPSPKGTEPHDDTEPQATWHGAYGMPPSRRRRRADPDDD